MLLDPPNDLNARYTLRSILALLPIVQPAQFERLYLEQETW
jgi:hypothetical protein